MYVTYTRIYGWSDYGGESSYQPGYRLENMMWMTLLVYDYIIPGENKMLFTLVAKGKLDIDTAAEEAGVSVSEFEKLMNEAGYKVPETV